MVSAILDTAILVDLMRKFQPSVNWLASQNQPDLAIHPIIWMEVIKGAPNNQEQRRATKLMEQFNFLELSKEDMHWGMEQQLKYQLSHGVGILDCLIAAPCARLNIPLYTRNLKHFAPLLNTLAVQPY